MKLLLDANVSWRLTAQLKSHTGVHNPTHFLPALFTYICSISYGVPCRIDKLFC